MYSLSEKTCGYSYSVENTKHYRMRVQLDCSKSENMLFSSASKVIEKEIEPGTTVFMMHSMVVPSSGQFKRSAECKVLEVDEH